MAAADATECTCCAALVHQDSAGTATRFTCSIGERCFCRVLFEARLVSTAAKRNNAAAGLPCRMQSVLSTHPLTTLPTTHNPGHEAIVHTACIEKWAKLCWRRAMVKNRFVCPIGHGADADRAQPCKGKVMQSHLRQIILKNQTAKEVRFSIAVWGRFFLRTRACSTLHACMHMRSTPPLLLTNQPLTPNPTPQPTHPPPEKSRCPLDPLELKQQRSRRL